MSAVLAYPRDREPVALEERCPGVLFQPVVPLRAPRCGEVCHHVEVLAPMTHPSYGERRPEALIGGVERSRRTEAMSFRLLHLALAQVALWRADGLAVDVAVNVPPSVIATPGFGMRVLEALDTLGIDGEHLTIELTEHGPSVTADSMRASLTALRAAGVGISINDFGSGYATFQRLFELPFSEIKIDRALIRSLLRSQKARTIVAWTINLAHTLGLRVCAEGVETSEQLAFLAGQACDLAQGFFVSEPLPASALRSFALHSREAAL